MNAKIPAYPSLSAFAGNGHRCIVEQKPPVAKGKKVHLCIDKIIYSLLKFSMMKKKHFSYQSLP
jgi:hypothetical protein